jgi:septum site-determining protein MinC
LCLGYQKDETQLVPEGGSAMEEMVKIKGTSNGLIITLGKGPLHTVLNDLTDRLASKASFFLGGRVALQVGDRPLSVEQLQSIGAAMEEMGMTLWAVEGSHPTTHSAALELGMETNLRSAAAPAPAEPAQLSREDMAGIIVRRTLRSGQAIRHAGHVTIIGDVNPGAEVVAAGDVIVWGKLLGTVHAGAMGDEEAVVCALQLAPSQIRIGAQIARSPERSHPPKVPEIASVQKEGIVVERWNKRK